MDIYEILYIYGPGSKDFIELGDPLTLPSEHPADDTYDLYCKTCHHPLDELAQKNQWFSDIVY